MGILRLINLFMAVVTYTREQTLKHLGTLGQTADRLHQGTVNQNTDLSVLQWENLMKTVCQTPFHQHYSAMTRQYLTFLVLGYR